MHVSSSPSKYHDVTLAGDTLTVTLRWDTAADSVTTAQVVPGLTDWQGFWRAADAAGVRSWPALCGQRDSAGTTASYDLRLGYEGDQLRSRGFDSYPGRNGQCSAAPTPEYQALLAAVGALIGAAYP